MTAKKIAALVLMVSTLSTVYGQENSDEEEEETGNSEIWIMPTASVGMEFYRDKNFQDFFADSLGTKYGQNLQTVNAGGYIGIDNGFSIHAFFSYRLPHIFNAPNGLTYQLSGFSFGYGVAMKYAPNQKFEMPFSLGYGIGKMYLWQNTDRMSNFFFDLYAILSPRIVLFDRLVLFGNGALYWDITKPRWKSETLITSGDFDFKHTCGAFQLGIGWKFESKF